MYFANCRWHLTAYKDVALLSTKARTHSLHTTFSLDSAFEDVSMVMGVVEVIVLGSDQAPCPCLLIMIAAK